jgi:hypothetical protein
MRAQNFDPGWSIQPGFVFGQAIVRSPRQTTSRRHLSAARVFSRRAVDPVRVTPCWLVRFHAMLHSEGVALRNTHIKMRTQTKVPAPNSRTGTVEPFVPESVAWS